MSTYDLISPIHPSFTLICMQTKHRYAASKFYLRRTGNQWQLCYIHLPSLFPIFMKINCMQIPCQQPQWYKKRNIIKTKIVNTRDSLQKYYSLLALKLHLQYIFRVTLYTNKLNLKTYDMFDNHQANAVCHPKLHPLLVSKLTYFSL